MIPISSLIKEFKSLKEKHSKNALLKEVRVVFLSPTLHIDLIGDVFDGLTEEARWKKIGESISESSAVNVDCPSTSVH